LSVDAIRFYEKQRLWHSDAHATKIFYFGQFGVIRDGSRGKYRRPGWTKPTLLAL
jgi:hypothetical protein